MTATFTWNPSYGATAGNEPKIKVARFGDGYEQRSQNGLNTNPETWTLQFTNRDFTEIDAIDSFLDARGGVEYFFWTPPRQSTAKKFICKKWDRQIVVGVVDSLSATFEQVFDN